MTAPTPPSVPPSVPETIIKLAARCTPEEISRLILYDLPKVQRRLTALRPASHTLQE